MTADPRQRLADLADSVAVGPVDVAAMRRTAVRRTYRARAAGALITASAVVAAVIAVGTIAGPRAEVRVADDLAQRTAVVPSEQRLREVLAAADPPVGIGDVRFCCQGPIRRPDSKNPGTRPYTTLPFGRDDRDSVYPELVMMPPADDKLQVNWSVVSPAMTNTEADDLARGVVPPDPAPVPVPVSQRLVQDTTGDIHSVVYAREEWLVAAAWSADGGYVRLMYVPTAADKARAEWMNTIARALITPQSPGGPSEPAAAAQLKPRQLRALQVGQVDGGAFGGTTASFGGPTVAAGKRIADGTGTSSYAVVAFAPPGVVGTCVARAVLRLDARRGDGTGPLNAYVAAYTSAARGQNPPPPGRAADLLDNRPAAIGQQRDGAWTFDATEMVRLVADGGAFPSRGRALPAGSPVVFVVRPPDATVGDYRVVFDASSAVLDVTAAPGCH